MFRDYFQMGLSLSILIFGSYILINGYGGPLFLEYENIVFGFLLLFIGSGIFDGIGEDSWFDFEVYFGGGGGGE